jgi:hypothetical protein
MGVEFEENNFSRPEFGVGTPRFAAWLIKKGLAKDVSGANKIQVIAAIIFFALAIFVAMR